MTRTIVVYGDSQAEALIPVLKRVPGLESVPIAYYPSVAGPSQAAVQALAGCLLTFAHPDRPEHPFPRHVLPADAASVRFAPLDFNPLWPWATAQPYPHVDRVINAGLAKGTPAGELLEYYLGPAWHENSTDLDALLASERERVLALDERCDVRTGELIVGNFTTHRLFWSAGRPTQLLWGELIGRLFAVAGRDFPAFAALDIPAFVRSLNADPFAQMQVPIHPRIVEHFGLSWYDLDESAHRTYFATAIATARATAPKTPDSLAWSEMTAEQRSDYYPAAVHATFGKGASGEIVTKFLTPAMLSLESAQIEITTWCNFACQQCERTLLTAEGKWNNQHISLEQCRTIIDTLPATRNLVLQGVGEPTLHPQFVEIVRMAVNAGRFGAITFNTNGQTHNEQWWRDVAKFPLLRVVLSIDSLDQEIATICRANTDVETLWSQLVLFRSVFSNFAVSMVLSRFNIDDFEKTLRGMAVLGKLEVIVQRMISMSTAAVLRPEDEARAHLIIASVCRDFPELTVLFDQTVESNEKRCVAPFLRPYITVDGYLTPCCASVDQAVYDHTRVDGKRNWNAIRSDERVDGWIRSFIKEDPEICRACSFNPNQAVSTRTEQSQRSFA